MPTTPAPDFSKIASPETKHAFLGGQPETTEWLPPGTKLFKWTQSITNAHGISPWWSLLESRRLSNGVTCPGIREVQERASRLNAHDRDYARTRAAVTQQWNNMTNCVAIELVGGAWGYIGKAAGQLADKNTANVFFIGGDYQVWVPNLTMTAIRRISILPYLQPNTPFGAK